MARVTVVLDGRSLDLAALVAVARHGAAVAIAPDAIDGMARSRRVVEDLIRREETVYGLSTGVGALKRVRVTADELARFNRMMVMNCLVGQGPPASGPVVRATLLRLANNLARGVCGVRPEPAELCIRALNEDWPISMRTLGSVGQADLLPLADLAAGLLDRDGFELAGGEALALIDNNAFATASAALAMADLQRLAATLEVAGALDLEAFAGNLSILHRIVRERPYPGLQASAARLRELLEGSWLWEDGAARNLQDPLTFRCLAQLSGALRDALSFTEGQLAIELNAAQSNPLVDVDEERILSGGSFEVLPLATALDLARIALAPVLTSANERVMKLLHAGFSGLPPGLAAHADRADDSFTEFGVAGQSLVAEARLLAAPVSFEIASSTQAEGIEDRMTMAPLAARRVAEMVALGERIVAIELVVAARACDLRPGLRHGAGTGAAHALVRSCIPPTGDGDPVPSDIEQLVQLVRAGAFAAV